jgi:hypothetical protein
MIHAVRARPNKASPPAYLLRESYRGGNKVRQRTRANITHSSLANNHDFRPSAISRSFCLYRRGS